MKAKLVKESLDNRMSVNEFILWFDNLLVEHSSVEDDEFDFAISTMIHYKSATDQELRDYLMDENYESNWKFVEELIDKRDYFLDFKYVQEIPPSGEIPPQIYK